MSRGSDDPPTRRRARRGPSTAALLVVTVVLTGTGIGHAPASATVTIDEGDDVVPVRLVAGALDAVVGPVTPPVGLPDDERALLPDPDVTARLLVENLTDEPLTGARLVVEVETPVGDRATLRARLEGRSTGFIGTAVPIDESIGTIAPGDVAQLTIELPGDELAFAPTGEASNEPIRIRPLTIAIVRGSTVLAEIRTAVVGIAGVDVPPLETAVVLPIDHEPTPLGPARGAQPAGATGSEQDATEGSDDDAVREPFPFQGRFGRADHFQGRCGCGRDSGTQKRRKHPPDEPALRLHPCHGQPPTNLLLVGIYIGGAQTGSGDTDHPRQGESW